MSRETTHDKEIHIVTGGDAAFVPGICVMTASALAAISENQSTSIHILDGGIPIKHRDRIKQICECINPMSSVHFYELDRYDFSNFDPGRNGSRMFYARLAMAEILSNLEKVIYIDSDTVVAGNLADLWSIDIKDNLAIVCRDRKIDILSKDCPWKLEAIDKQKSYFNSGMMLTNLLAWRESKIYEKALSLASKSKNNLKWWDQTLLNFLLKDDIDFVSEQWNWQREQMPMKSESLGIIHFTTSKKPWFYCGGDWRHKLWRSVYRKYFGSPLGLFWNQKRFKGLIYGFWDHLVVTNKFFLGINILYLRCCLLVISNKENRKGIEKSLGFYEHLVRS